MWEIWPEAVMLLDNDDCCACFSRIQNMSQNKTEKLENGVAKDVWNRHCLFAQVR